MKKKRPTKKRSPQFYREQRYPEVRIPSHLLRRPPHRTYTPEEYQRILEKEGRIPT